jgi:site-specific DNA-cytosine methylase
MIVVSLFDGMSCGQLALERAGVSYSGYMASEIDRWAIQVCRHNFPATVHLGDVTALSSNDLPRPDLLIGGSPCQGFSYAGKMRQFDDPRSRLFFEYVRLLEELQPRWFLLENVVMPKDSQDIISGHLGVQPVCINSSLVSAQNRNRLYWTNIPVSVPIDRGLRFGDIREHGVPERYYYTDKAMQWLKKESERTGKALRVWSDSDKVQMLEASMYKKYSSQRFFGIPDTNGLRYITPTECERAQTVPDGYTSTVSDTQRYKMLGNGWTVEVIAHIFRGLNS